MSSYVPTPGIALFNAILVKSFISSLNLSLNETESVPNGFRSS